jgi:competence protein ComEA
MNQRLTLTAAGVVLAAGAAVFRLWYAPAPRALAVAPASALANPLAVRALPGRSPSPGAGLPAAASASSRRAVVYVAGEVLRPGVYALPESARAVDALHAAGGPAGDADLVAVNLAEHVLDGQEIVVQAKGVARSPVRSTGGDAVRAGRRSARKGRHRWGSRMQKAPPTEVVDLNRADPAELEELPGVGPALAEQIVAFRDLNGPFASLDDLLDVNGMSDSRLEEIAPYATVR